MPLTPKLIRHLLFLIVVPLLMCPASAWAQSCKQPMAAALSRRLKVIYVEKGQEQAVARKLNAEIVSPRSWKLPAIAATEAGMEQPPPDENTVAMSKAMTVELIPSDGPISEGVIADLKGDRVPGPNELIVVYEHSACSEQTAAKSFICHKQGAFWVTITSQAFKTCKAIPEESMCTERLKSTHTITIWRDPQCTVLKKKIIEAQMRCD